MPARTDAFEEYLAQDETIEEAVRGTFADGAHRSAGTIGVTDRRLLFVSEADGFLDVSLDSISSIRSHPRSTFTAAGLGYPLLVLLGVVVAISGVVGSVMLRPGATTFALSLVAVVGPVAAEYVRRSGAYVDPEAIGALRRVVRERSGSSLGALAGLDPIRRPSPDGSTPADNDALVLAIGLVSLLALVGLVAVSGTLLVVPLTLAALGGIAAAEYASRRTRRLGGEGRSRRRERDVSVRLVDGRTVEFRVDADDRIDRTLSATERGSLRRPGPTASGGSTAEVTGTGQ